MEGYYCTGGASVPNPTSMYSSDIIFFFGGGWGGDTFKLFKKRKKSNVFLYETNLYRFPLPKFVISILFDSIIKNVLQKCLVY